MPVANVQLQWATGVSYNVGSIVERHGGFWRADVENRNSPPISGNARWTLVGGVPYVDVVLDPVALTTAPFKDLTSSGPGLTVVPAPGPGLIALPRYYSKLVNAGDGWGQDPTINIGWGAAVIQSDYSVSIDAQGVAASDPVVEITAQTLDPRISNYIFWGRAGTDPTIINQPIVLWNTNDITDNGGGPGSQIGTRSIDIRLEYRIVPAVFSSPTFFTISAVNQGTKTLTVSPDPTGLTGSVTIVGSTGNNAPYTVASTTATTITVNEALPDATGDGWVKK